MRAKKVYKIRAALADVYQDEPGAEKTCLLTFAKIRDDYWRCTWSFAGWQRKVFADSLLELLDVMSKDFEIDEWRGQIKGGLK